MQPSRFQSIQLPSALTRPTPANIAQAGSTPTRVLVRNYTGVDAMVTFNAVIDNFAAPSNAYLLPAGASDVFMIAPGQALYAVGAAGGCKLAVAISEAFPVNSTSRR